MWLFLLLFESANDCFKNFKSKFVTNFYIIFSDNSRSTGRGYQRLGQKDADTDRKSDTEESNEESEESDLEEGSDSEFGK